jgi:hypothetical protein
VKTARFAKVVEKAGRPEIYLTLIDPTKDSKLQAAVKAHRVMTVSQESVGNKTDRGEIGFEAGAHRQFLVFPKTLKAFAGRTVVGIKYDLLEDRELPKNQRAAPARAPRTPKPKRAPKIRTEKRKPEPASAPKVVPFKPEPIEDEEDDEIADLKKQVRHAMRVLEDGKAVAAFNLLKRIVGD